MASQHFYKRTEITGHVYKITVRQYKQKQGNTEHTTRPMTQTESDSLKIQRTATLLASGSVNNDWCRRHKSYWSSCSIATDNELSILVVVCWRQYLIVTSSITTWPVPQLHQNMSKQIHRMLKDRIMQNIRLKKNIMLIIIKRNIKES